MVLATNPRIWVQDPELNREGVTWKDFCSDPEVMFQTALKYKEHLAFNLPFDQEMGVPAEAWTLEIVFGNVVEEAWFGAEILYPEGQVSATVPNFIGEHKQVVFERGIPDPFGGIMAEQQRFYEYFLARAADFEFHGRPVRVSLPSPLGTDGPLTVANGLRGPELFEDMLRDQAYFHELMSFVTTAIIQRIRAWRAHLKLEPGPKGGYLADDAIQFLSVKSYREHVLPYHRQILDALWGEGPHFMHLCGNVQRHFPTLVRELNVKAFDTGFPIRFETLRDEVGEDVEIQGGVQAADLVACSAQEITRKSIEILTSGIRRGGRFIFKEANNLPPRVPIQNLEAMYTAVKEFARFNTQPE
jgi:uroporphyrinogen-III decarboxylase